LTSCRFFYNVHNICTNVGLVKIKKNKYVATPCAEMYAAVRLYTRTYPLQYAWCAAVNMYAIYMRHFQELLTTDGLHFDFGFLSKKSTHLPFKAFTTNLFFSAFFASDRQKADERTARSVIRPITTTAHAKQQSIGASRTRHNLTRDNSNENYKW